MADIATPHITTRLGDVCGIQSSLVDPRDDAFRGLRHIGGANIASGTGHVIDLKTAEDDELISGKHLFCAEDVLYSKIRPYLRKVVLPSFRGLCSADIYPLRPKRDVLEREYLFYLLLSDSFTDYANRASNRAGMPKINREQLFSFEFVLPSLPEQKRVVARVRECAHRIDEIRALRTESDREAVALLPSSLAAVFDDLAKTFDGIPIGSVISETRYGTSLKCNAGIDATPVLRIPNVANGRIGFEELKYCRLPQRDLQRLALAPGDLLVVRTNGSPDLVGRCAVFEGASKPFAFASYLIRIRVGEAADPYYVAFFLSSTRGRDAIAAIRRTSAGQYNINSGNLREIRIPLPPVGEQRRVAERLREQQDVVRAVTAEQAIRLTEVEQLRAAVLRKALAGEL